MKTIMLDTSAAAARLGLRPKSLEEWRRRRCSPVPYYKVGASVRYSSADLDAYLERQRIPADKQ